MLTAIAKFYDPLKGRGSQQNPDNPFLSQRLDTEAEDGLDEPLTADPRTRIVYDHPKKVLNKVPSPDIPLDYSINPYQGCEHGCTYCYARKTHEFWGYSAGLDFERVIIVKENVAELLQKELSHPKWEPTPIMFSGNTDCYQPLERELKLTRQCLEVFEKMRHPVSLITKNSLILRDLDLLQSLAQDDLVHVAISITTNDEDLRRKMEPRTASSRKRWEVVRTLSEAGVPVFAMLAPVIPGINQHELPRMIEQAAEAGAVNVGYTLVHLDGTVGKVFEDWLRETLPDRADKVLNQIRDAHGGSLEDKRYGTRMRGEGEMANSISQLFRMLKKKHFGDRKAPPYNLTAFRKPGQMRLF